MKIAVIYNRDSNNVINLFGTPNKERYGKKTIGRIVDGLIKHGHQVKTFEGDKDLITNLEQFMPSNMAARMAMMAITTRSSIRVNPCVWRNLMRIGIIVVNLTYTFVFVRRLNCMRQLC